MSNQLELATGAERLDPLADFLKPPSGMWLKLKYYSKRYGVLHAICSFVGRKWLPFWLRIGPLVTRPYLHRWLGSPGLHVLNLGGGGLISHRWLTADVDPRADVFMDVTQPLPIPDQSVDVVFSEEVIEHISREAGRRMLRECVRILKPGGVLRITTPSLDYFSKQALCDVAAVQSINDIFYGHGHQFIYSQELLNQVLRESGLVNIQQSAYRDLKAKYGHFDSHPARFKFAPPEWSQYWEAEKPVVLPCNNEAV